MAIENMHSKKLAEIMLDTVTPFLVEFLDPGSLSWFDTSNKDNVKRKQADIYWQIITNSNLFQKELLSLLKNYSKFPNDTSVRLNLIEKLYEVVSSDPALQSDLNFDINNINNNIHIGGGVSKSNIVIGNNNSVSNYSVSVGAAQTVFINQGGVNRSAQIQDVGVSFELPTGKFPVYYWLDRSGVYSILGDKSWWDPSGYTYDLLMDTLMKEINRWTNDGWEVIENDLDNLWIYDQGYQERFVAYLTRLAVPAGTVLKHWRRYKGAQFHVRRFL